MSRQSYRKRYASDEGSTADMETSSVSATAKSASFSTLTAMRAGDRDTGCQALLIQPHDGLAQGGGRARANGAAPSPVPPGSSTAGGPRPAVSASAASNSSSGGAISTAVIARRRLDRSGRRTGQRDGAARPDSSSRRPRSRAVFSRCSNRVSSLTRSASSRARAPLSGIASRSVRAGPASRVAPVALRPDMQQVRLAAPLRTEQCQSLLRPAGIQPGQPRPRSSARR